MRRVEHPTKKVLTGPEWIYQLFDGFTRGNSMIKPIQDPDGNWILGKAILGSKKWDLSMRVGPSPNEQKPIYEWLEEIPFVYWEYEEQELKRL